VHPVPDGGEVTCMSYEEEDTCMSYEEEDTCMSYHTGACVLCLMEERCRVTCC
jgi:hypothetical protein